MSSARRSIVALALVCASAPAFAQDTYVSASLTGDIARFSKSETENAPGFDPSGNGESIGFALRVGTSLGAAWGVEAEFARGSEIENEGRPGAIPVPLPAGSSSLVFTDLGVSFPNVPDVSIYPPISYRFRSEQSRSTFSAAIWARQDLSDGFALVYSGGVGFHVVEDELEVSYEFVPLPLPVPGLPTRPIALPSPTVTETTTYSTRPFAGIEGRIRMTEHLELVPGVRVHGLEGGVLVRPSVGLGWNF